MKDVYSPFKAAYHFDRIKKLREREVIFPTQIQLDLTNQCNHDCVYCFSKFTITNNHNTFIDTPIVMKLLDDAKRLGILAFHYTGGGEPFEHKDIYDILAKTVDNELEYGMVTNGTLIDVKNKSLAKMSWIRVSIDASTEEMYKKLRGVDEFKEVILFVKEFGLRCPDTVLGLSFVINPLNYSQIVSFAELGKELEVDNIRYSIAWSPSGEKRYEDLMKEINLLLKEANRLQTPDYRIFNLTKGRLPLFNPKDKDYDICGYQHFTTVIGADSRIYPCCTLKYNKEAEFGNLKEQSFEEIWLGEKRMKWIQGHHLEEVCAKNICWMESKNDFIGYLINKNPKHVSFI